jgi:hypothetical protein
MGLVTGTTTHKLDLIKTYNPTTPYVVGTNGVTDLYKDGDGYDVVEYTIDGIDYTTTLKEEIVGPLSETKAININANLNKSYLPGRKKGRLDESYPTTFKYVTNTITEDSYFVFKDESKMGVVFTPKVYEDVFIERQRVSVFESQSRLAQILTLESLEEYNNGYYNVTKTE